MQIGDRAVDGWGNEGLIIEFTTMRQIMESQDEEPALDIDDAPYVWLESDEGDLFYASLDDIKPAP